MDVRDHLVTVVQEMISPGREHNQMPIMLRDRETSYVVDSAVDKGFMLELLHYTDPYAEYLLASDAPLAEVPVLSFCHTKEDYDVQPQVEFFARTSARAHESHCFSYDGLDLIIVAALVTY